MLPERLEELYKFNKTHVAIRNHEGLEALRISFNSSMPATAAPSTKKKKERKKKSNVICSELGYGNKKSRHK